MPRYTFAIGDVHGRYDLLLLALDKIERIYPEGGTVVFLGDYIDRGPSSKDVIQALRNGPCNGIMWKWVCLKGNHEELMMFAIAIDSYDTWLDNGASSTLRSYGIVDLDMISESIDAIPESDLRWVNGLPSFYEDAHRFYVHGGVRGDAPISEQPDSILLWHRYRFDEEGWYKGKHIVHGHDPYDWGPVLHSGRTNLDTQAWKSDKLFVAVFDDAVIGGAVDYIQVCVSSASVS